MPKEASLNLFAPTYPHTGQLKVLDALDNGARFVLLRAGRKWRKSSLGISWLFEKALTTPNLTYPYISPSRIQSKNIVWRDHIARLLNEFKSKGLEYKVNETELSVELPNQSRVQLHGVDNPEALRGHSNWGAIVCVTGDTVVLTTEGEKKITEIQTNDYVITPLGTRKVLNSGQTGIVNHLIKITLSSGETLIATPNHKIFTESGVAAMDELTYNDFIWTQKLLNTKGLNTEIIKAITGQELEVRQGTYIERFGLKTLEKYQPDTSFITRMVIKTITQLKTWFASLHKNTHRLTQEPEYIKTKIGFIKTKYKKLLISLSLMKDVRLLVCEPKVKDFQTEHLTPQKSGMDLKKVKNGTQSEQKKIGQIGKQLKRFVKNVTQSTTPTTQKDQDTAPHVVEIESLYVPEGVPVYNLTVNFDHCFFANGILVKNCDEYDDWSEDIYPTIIRPNLITHRAPVLVMGTPKGMGNLYRLEKNPDFKSFHFTSLDNPDIPKEEIQSLIKEYKDYGEDYYRQEILAEYVKPIGIVYKEFDSIKQVKRVEYDEHLPLYVTFDWGVNDPTVIIWIQVNGQETRVIDYYEASDASIEHFISVLNSKPYKRPEMYTGDPAGKARTLTTGTSVIEMLAEKGIYVKTKDGVRIPEQIRITHQRIPNLYVDQTNGERFVECLLNYKYPEKRSSAINQINEIPVHNWASHALRAFEYFCVNYSPIVVGARNERFVKNDFSKWRLK